jgi:hypothetical protein
MSHALLVAWRSGTGDRGWGPVGRLEYDGQDYCFVYTRGARTLEGFRPFPQMEDLEQVYVSSELFPIFANRLLSKSRPEYEAFLRWGGFESDNPPDPISILGVTEGIRQTDSVEVFPCPVPDSSGCYLNKFFAHGLQYLPAQSHERLLRLQPGEQLVMMPDPFNESDEYAMAVRTVEERMIVGYFPRYLARDAWRLLQECDPDFMRIFVERVNPDAPLQQRLLCRMNACWPEGFHPCADDSFLPIPEGVQPGCPA